MLAAQKNDQREDRDPDRNRDGFPIGLAFPFFLGLADFEALPLILLLIERSGGLDEPVDGVILIQPQRPRIGSDEPPCKNLIR